MPDLLVPPRDMLLTAIVEDTNKYHAYVVEGRQTAREGEVLKYSVLWTGFNSLSVGVTVAYQNGTDISSSALSGSELLNGRTQGCRILTIPAGSGGTTIVLECTITGAVPRATQTRKVGITIDILSVGATK